MKSLHFRVGLSAILLGMEFAEICVWGRCIYASADSMHYISIFDAAVTRIFALDLYNLMFTHL